MKTKFIVVGAIALLAIGAGLHHTGNCPLKHSKAVAARHSVNVQMKESSTSFAISR